jgi:hypothetical protein
MVVFASKQSKFQRAGSLPLDRLQEGWEEAKCGLGYAFANRGAEARRACEALLERPSADATWRLVERFFYARAALVLGDAERALSTLERVAPGPGWVTPAWLRLDPMFAPLRDNPRLKRLVALQ